MSYYDNELRTLLSEEITNNSIVVINNTKDHFDYIGTHFPISANRIDWREVKDSIHSHLTKEETERFASCLNLFFENIESKYPINDNETILIIGDSLTDFSYQMSYDIFKKTAIHFLQIPQHTYCLLMNINCCLNYTFEDSIYFGREVK
ncbi:MAG: hypothetical protein ACRC3B_15485 [Bacteroidia bacterium]